MDLEVQGIPGGGEVPEYPKGWQGVLLQSLDTIGAADPLFKAGPLALGATKMSKLYGQEGSVAQKVWTRLMNNPLMSSQKARLIETGWAKPYTNIDSRLSAIKNTRSGVEKALEEMRDTRVRLDMKKLAEYLKNVPQNNKPMAETPVPNVVIDFATGEATPLKSRNAQDFINTIKEISDSGYSKKKYPLLKSVK